MQQAPAPEIDPAYLGRLRARADILFSSSLSAREGALRTRRDMSRMGTSLASQFHALHEELVRLDAQSMRAGERVRAAAAGFSTCVKRSQVQRVQLRVDAWGPEKRMSRDAFLRMLADELSRESALAERA